MHDPVELLLCSLYERRSGGRLSPRQYCLLDARALENLTRRWHRCAQRSAGRPGSFARSVRVTWAVDENGAGPSARDVIGGRTSDGSGGRKSESGGTLVLAATRAPWLDSWESAGTRSTAGSGTVTSSGIWMPAPSSTVPGRRRRRISMPSSLLSSHDSRRTRNSPRFVC